MGPGYTMLRPCYSDFWNLNVTKHKRKSFTNMAVKPGSNSFYEISAILASFAKSDDFFPGVLPIMGYTGREALPERGTFFRLVQPPPKCSWPRNDPQPLNDPQFDPEMTPIPKWSPGSSRRPRNDPQLILGMEWYSTTELLQVCYSGYVLESHLTFH